MAFQIRQGRPADWQEILDVSRAAFSAPSRYFPRGWPHTYPGPRAAERFVVCEEAGRILGVINQTPVPLRIAGVRLNAVGIGGVATLKKHRGRGVMSAMLNASNACQRDAGTCLGFLWGERERYRRYGYEIAGSGLTANFGPKQFADVEPVPLRKLTQKDAPDILRLYRRSTLVVDRTEPWQRLLLRRATFAAYGNRSGPLKAYLVSGRKYRQNIHELIGNAKLLPGLLKAHRLRNSLNEVALSWVTGYRAHLELGRAAASVRADVLTQINIFDFGRFLEKLAAPLGEGFRRSGITGPVRVVHAGERAAFDLALRPTGELLVTRAKPGGKADLALDAAGKRDLAPDAAGNADLAPDAAGKADLVLDAPGWVRTFFPPPGGLMLEEKADYRLLAALRLPLAMSAWDSL